jgi:UDPglucose 6-dehydrogenase
VPVGTADQVSEAIADELKQRSEDIPYSVASNPEFLKEGDAVSDFMKPDRIVIGTADPRAENLLRELYAPFNRNHDRVFAMDVRSAELTKYAANAMLATKISFMNEMANIAECVGADIEHVRLGIGSDSRIGYSFIYPGCGYGGSCFPKDVRAVEQTARAHGYTPRILPAVDAVNEAQKEVLFLKIKNRLGELTGKTIAVWGLAFKPNTDDMREASSLVLIRALLEAGATVRAHDPESMPVARAMVGEGVEFCDDPYTALEGADALAIVTEWKAFRSPDFARIKTALNEPVIFDGRNLYDPAVVSAAGLEYHAIGRPVAKASE